VRRTKGLFEKRPPPPHPATSMVAGAQYTIQRDADGAITIIAKARSVKDLRRLLRNLNEAVEEIIAGGKGRKAEDEE